MPLLAMQQRTCHLILFAPQSSLRLSGLLQHEVWRDDVMILFDILG